MIDTRPSDRRAKPAPNPTAASPMPAQRTESREALQPATVETPLNTNEPSKEEIAALAYQLWIERGSPHGSHEEDWSRAEEQLRSRQTLNRKAASILAQTAKA